MERVAIRWPLVAASVVLSSLLAASCTNTNNPSPPPAPTGVLATAGDGRVTVTWTAVSGATSYAVYYGTTSGVTKATGTKLSPATSPQAVTGLTNGTAYYFVVTASNSDGESGQSTQTSATPAAPSFTQADLTGDWDVIDFGTNANGGWSIVHVSVNASGQLTVLSSLDDSGDTSLPGSGFDLTLSIDAGGDVTMSGANASPAFHGAMTASKTLIFAVNTNGSTGGGFALTAWRKRLSNVAYSMADVENVAFAYFSIYSGSATGWEYGDGVTNGSGALTILHNYDPAGAGTPPPANFATLSVDANGLVTLVGAPYHGVMTPDKKGIFFVATSGLGPPKEFQLLVVLLTGQTFTQADLAGAYDMNVVYSATTTAASSWAYGTVSIDTTGLATFTSIHTSAGGTTPPAPFPVTMSSTGALTRAGDATYHGQMGWGKDYYVRTAGTASAPNLAVLAR